MTYSALGAKVDALAGQLVALGTGRGQVVALKGHPDRDVVLGDQLRTIPRVEERVPEDQEQVRKRLWDQQAEVRERPIDKTSGQRPPPAGDRCLPRPARPRSPAERADVSR